MDFGIVEEKNKTLRILLTSLVFIGGSAIFIFSIKEKVSFLAVFIFNLASSLTTFEKLKYKKTGVFRITNSSIEIKNNNADKIIINKKDISGMIIHHKYFNSKNIFQRRSGALVIDIINCGKKISFELYVKNWKKKELFREKLRELYKQNIKIKEIDVNGVRSFLFKSNLTYREIQEIKREFNMTWI